MVKVLLEEQEEGLFNVGKKAYTCEGGVTHLGFIHLNDNGGSTKRNGSWFGFSLSCMWNVCWVVRAPKGKEAKS